MPSCPNPAQLALLSRLWQAWFAVMCVLAALWLQSYVPWTICRLCAAGLGITTVNETPAGLLAASVSARQFWRQFHASWHQWLLRYVYWPLGGGGGAGAMAAVMAVSTALHGLSG